MTATDDKQVLDWSLQDVTTWLTRNGLQDHVDKFRDQEIDGETLLGLTESMVTQLLPTMKAQVKFNKLRRELQEPQPGTSNMTIVTEPTAQIDAQIDEDTDTSEPTRWSYPYIMPEMPPRLKSALEAKDTRFMHNSSLRSQLLQSLLDDIVLKAGWYPSKSQYSDVMHAVMTKYPFLREQGNDTGYELLLFSLKTKMKNERKHSPDPVIAQVKEKFRRDGSGRKRTSRENTDGLTKASRKTNTKECIGEDMESMSAHERFLLQESQKTRPHVAHMIDRANRSHAPRKEVLQSKPLQELMTQYPWLKIPKMLMNEMSLIKGIDVHRCLSRKLGPLAEQIVKAASGQLKVMCQTHIEDVIEENQKKEITLNAAILLLPSLFKESALIAINEDPKHAVPTLCVCCPEGKPLLPTSLSVLMDNMTIVEDDTNEMDIVMGVACIFCAYWVYGVKYGKGAVNSLSFIEHYLSGLQCGKPTARIMRCYNMLTSNK